MSTAQKTIVKVLIIDDDRGRDDAYKQFFERLSADAESLYDVRPLLPHHPFDAVDVLTSKEPQLVILDMLLSGNWQEQCTAIYNAINAASCPVVFLSGNFEEQAAGQKATSLLKNLTSLKLGFLPYAASIQKHFEELEPKNGFDSLPSDTVGLWKCMIGAARGENHQWQPQVPGEITFLHLTDTHFGEKIKADYLNLVGMQNGARDKRADYVIWTGDITEHGYPNEFEEAQRFSEQLKNSDLLGKKSAIPFSITPGNHDLCRPLALASRLRLDKEPSHTNEAPTPWKWQVDDTDANPELISFGLAPFRQFFTKVVGESYPERGFRLLTQWKHHGFVILELPLEAHVVLSRSDQNPLPPSLISEEQFIAITNEVIFSFEQAQLNRNICVIVLIHGRTPDSAKLQANRWRQLINTICNENHPVIVMGGHEHTKAHCLERNCLSIIGVPSNEAMVGSLTLPGVSFIRLSGFPNNLKCEIYKLQKYDDQGVPSWQLIAPRSAQDKFQIHSDTGHWISAN